MIISIQLAPDAPEAAAFAAQELRRYLRRMLPGVSVELGGGQGAVIALELLPAGEEEPDTFQVELSPAGGRIAGNRPIALLTGVYDCLYRLGCRFPSPDPAEELVPEIRPGDLSLRYTRAASYRHRGVCIEGANSLENIRDFIAWMPKIGFNSFFLQFKVPYTFLARWYHHENNPLLPAERYDIEDARRDTALLVREIKKRGMALHSVGHGWTGQVLGYESVAWKPEALPLPEEKRPLAALINGKRELFLGIPMDTNLCLSEPEALDRFASLVVDYAREHPETDYLHIWLADEYNNVCECPRCRSVTPTDQYVRLLNEIDRRLTALGLKTKLVFLLYQELLWPPARERLNDSGRFVLMFAPISRTFEQAYSLKEAGGRLPPYRRNRIVLPHNLAENLAFLRLWQREFSGGGFVYDYPLGRAHYGDPGYLHISRVIGRDIRQLKEMGLDGYISCQELRAGLPNYLPNYVMGRMLFDREEKPESLFGEYFRAVYGEAYETARAYLSALSELDCCDYINGIGPREDRETARRARQMQAVCDRFAPALEQNRASGPAWRRLCYHLSYTRLLAGALESLASGEKEQASARWLALRRLLRENESAFQAWLDVYRVLEVTVKYTGFDAGTAGRSI